MHGFRKSGRTLSKKVAESSLRSVLYHRLLTMQVTCNCGQAPGIWYLKKHVSNACKTMNKSSSDILRELAITVKTMTKSSKMGLLVQEMNTAVQKLQISLKSIPSCLIAPTSEETADEAPFRKTCITPLVEVIPLTTFVSLLIENAARINGIVDAVNELAVMVDMKHGSSKKTNTVTTLPQIPKP